MKTRPCREPDALSDHSASPARLQSAADCPHRVAERGHRSPCAQAFLSGRTGCGASAYPARQGAEGYGSEGAPRGSRVIELDPHEVSVSSANWSTELLGSVLGSAHRDKSHGGDGARVLACQWVRLQTPDVDRCLAKRQNKRVTWEKTAGRGRVSRSHSRLHLYPYETWSKLICGVNAPLDVPGLLALLPRADLYAARMRCTLPFTQPLRGSGGSAGR
jgi:hypothetical protein